MDRADLGKAAEDVHEVTGLELLAGRGDEDDEHLARVPALAIDEVPQVALSGRLVVGLELLLASPGPHGQADRVSEVGGEQAFLDVDHLVPAAGAVEAELDLAVLAGREGVLELVAVVVERRRGDDGLDGWLLEAADADEGVTHLLLLGGDLRVVDEILEPAAAALPDPEVAAGCLDALRARVEDCLGCGLREPALDLRHARAHPVTGKGSADEDHESVDAPDPAPPVRERVDADLDLFALLHRRSHSDQRTSCGKRSRGHPPSIGPVLRRGQRRRPSGRAARRTRRRRSPATCRARAIRPPAAERRRSAP